MRTAYSSLGRYLGILLIVFGAIVGAVVIIASETAARATIDTKTSGVIVALCFLAFFGFFGGFFATNCSIHLTGTGVTYRRWFTKKTVAYSDIRYVEAKRTMHELGLWSMVTPAIHKTDGSVLNLKLVYGFAGARRGRSRSIDELVASINERLLVIDLRTDAAAQRALAS